MTSYPLLSLIDLNISIYFPFSHVQIGYASHSHLIIFPQENIKEKKNAYIILEEDAENNWNVSFFDLPGIWINKHFCKEKSPISSGDLIRIDHFRFQFSLHGADFSQSQSSIQIPKIMGAQEQVATESLRIISRKQKGKKIQEILHSIRRWLAIFFILIFTYVLWTKQTLKIRSYLQR